MERGLQLTFFICLLFACLFIFGTILASATFKGTSFSRGGDFNAHFEMASNPNFNTGYSPFYRTLTSPFSFSANAFFYLSVIIIVFVPPLMFYYYFKSALPTILYFATGFPYRMFMGSFYSMSLAMVLFIPFIITKNRFLKLGILIFSLFIHAQAFNLFLLGWLFQEAYFIFNKNVAPMLFCGKPVLDFEGINPVQLVSKNSAPPFSLNLGLIWRFFLKDFNLILVYYAIKGFKVSKRMDLFFVAIGIFIGCFFVYSRAIYVLCLLGICGVSLLHIHKPFKSKIFYLFIFALVIINLIDFIVEFFLTPMGFCV